jgi:hypothetical protein
LDSDGDIPYSDLSRNFLLKNHFSFAGTSPTSFLASPGQVVAAAFVFHSVQISSW